MSTTMAVIATREAKIASCKIIDKTFNSKEATISQKQEYTECIKELYPASIDPGGIIIFKLLFVIGLLSAIIGGYRESKYHSEVWADILLSSILYGLGIPVLICVVLGIMIGIFWVLGIQL